jgi:hypothetical protein
MTGRFQGASLAPHAASTFPFPIIGLPLFLYVLLALHNPVALSFYIGFLLSNFVFGISGTLLLSFPC